MKDCVKNIPVRPVGTNFEVRDQKLPLLWCIKTGRRHISIEGPEAFSPGKFYKSRHALMPFGALIVNRLTMVHFGTLVKKNYSSGLISKCGPSCA